MHPPLNLRVFQPSDAASADAFLRKAVAGAEHNFPETSDALTAGTMRLSQAGRRFLIAERGTTLCGIVCWWEDDGIAWFSLLASSVPGAGRSLLRAVERAAQDAGLRSLRATIPDARGLPDYFARFGYRPVARRPGAFVVEKRLPLLTVREQRRADAAAIAALTGEDPWPFEQGSRPGWFVLADGDRVAGVVAARDNRDGTARVTHLVLADGYAGRALEAWMLDRVATWAETAGSHTVDVPRSPVLDRLASRLESSRWFPEGNLYRRGLA